jgi:hypothetical protein
LIHAAEKGDLEIFDAIMQHCPKSIHSTNKEGQTAFIVAARNGNDEMIMVRHFRMQQEEGMGQGGDLPRSVPAVSCALLTILRSPPSSHSSC